MNHRCVMNSKGVTGLYFEGRDCLCCSIARVEGIHFPYEHSIRDIHAAYTNVCICLTEVNMAEVSERTLQVAVVVSFAAGFVAGWQANRMRRKFLDWRKKRLQDKLSETQKKLDLA
uniref:Mitoregulin n=2 Tax=Eupercaria TaxID=1489922 RepID=A0A3Q3EWR4_9LABR